MTEDAPSPHTTMHAVTIPEFGPSEVLTYGEQPTPEPRRRQVLVRVHAASINPRDWMIRSGTYVFKAMLPRLPFIPGSDVAGVVAASESPRFRPGDRVFAMVPSSDGFGGYAEYVAVRESALAPMPDGLPVAEAAAMPLAALTALQALRDDGRLRPGQRVVVVGAVGGVGHYGVQIARALEAGEVVGVCSEANHDLARELGCHRVIDYRKEDYTRLLHDVDLVFDTIGRGSLGAASRVLTHRGAYVTTVPTARAILDAVRTRLWPFGRRCRIVLVKSKGVDLELLASWTHEGRLRSVIDRTAPLADARLLHDHSRTFRTRGKNVLMIP